MDQGGAAGAARWRQRGRTEVLLGEVLALRTILLTPMFSLANRKAVTPEAMRELIERADGDKARRAVEGLTAARAAEPATGAAAEPEPEAGAESTSETGPEEG